VYCRCESVTPLMKLTFKTLFIITILFLLSIENVKAQSVDTTRTMVSVLDSVFSVIQVERGTITYEESCGVCHQPAQFTGSAFIDAWKGQTVFDFFSLVKTTMPYGSPSSLTNRNYTDILAYLLSLNGFPAGSADMPSNTRILKQIRIDSIPKAGGPEQRPLHVQLMCWDGERSRYGLENRRLHQIPVRLSSYSAEV